MTILTLLALAALIVYLAEYLAGMWLLSKGRSNFGTTKGWWES